MKTVGRYLTLAFLSAITAEFLLGDQWLNGGTINVPGQVAALLLYAAFYGSAAVLIREVTRRTGRGWPTILVLALAFGLLEEGLVDQSLFNPHFVGEHLLRFGFIPGLGIGGPWTIFVLSIHVIWSIGAPIAIAEAIYPRPLPRRAPVSPQTQAPWLPIPAIVALLLLFVLAAFAIFQALAGSHFLASVSQLIASAVGVIALIVVALLLPRRTPRAVRPFGIAAAVGVVVTSAFVILEHLGAGLSPWLVVGLSLVILALGVVLAATLRLDVLGLAAGAILTYSWLGMSKAIPLGAGPMVEQSVIVVLVLATVSVGVIRRTRSS